MAPPLSASQAVQHYREREEAYFNALTPDAQTFLAHHGLTAADSFLFGEFAFVLLGLKPCLLVDLPGFVAEQYYDRVLDPLQPMLAALDLCLRRIDHPLMSPEMPTLEGMLLIYQNHQHNRVATAALRDSASITEETLRRLLDYPGTLPADESQLETMVEVIYYIHMRDSSAENQSLALTTYAAQESELGQVREHFKRYQEACRLKLGMELLLLVRRPVLS
ncbi:hypothetical protein BX666DRAFT_2111384 [Dichotomocladium elegans]|nr:hypothetical protein BX666DRAFT_2111384 [Dichotomocladium elegans]